MSFRNTLLILMSVTVLGWVSWLLVINKLSPFFSGYIALTFFYSSLTIALSGSFALLIFSIRSWISRNVQYRLYFFDALRQGILLSIMFNTALIFQRLRVLTWWDGLLLLSVILLLEYYFSSDRTS